jgi:hypothetical protein
MEETMLRTNARVLMGAIMAVGLSMTIGCETMDPGSKTGDAPTPAATPAAGEPAMAAVPTSGPQPAAGTSGDSLQACMARIPQDATASQRMLGERTCQRDEETRQPIARVPGAN